MGKCVLSDLTFAEFQQRFPADAPISDQDRQIAQMSARGCSTVEISLACHISTATVSRRRRSIIRRAGL